MLNHPQLSENSVQAGKIQAGSSLEREGFPLSVSTGEAPGDRQVGSVSRSILSPVLGASPSPLVVAWVSFLGRWDWAWFCNLTSRDPIHPEQLNKRFRFWVFEANCKLYPYRVRTKANGRRDLRLRRDEGIYWCRAMELQRRGVWHLHALLGGVADLRRLSYMDLWNERCGFAKIEPPDCDEAVRRYVAKYVVKSSRLGDIDLGGTLARYKPFAGLAG
jgi:hypothetical protein